MHKKANFKYIFHWFGQISENPCLPRGGVEFGGRGSFFFWNIVSEGIGGEPALLVRMRTTFLLRDPLAPVIPANADGVCVKHTEIKDLQMKIWMLLLGFLFFVWYYGCRTADPCGKVCPWFQKIIMIPVFCFVGWKSTSSE
jgi:hypothetical protein